MMTIQFDADRWEQVRRTYRLWWAGQLDRAIVPVELSGRQPDRAKPNLPLLTQGTCADLSIRPDQIIDRLDYELSTRVYLGDAFPFVGLDAFGPGIITAMLGARLENSTGQVWFLPPDDVPIQDLHFDYDPDNVWLRRIKDICAAARHRWQGQVLVGMTDLGGNLDILSVFRPGDRLLLDLYDHPDEVKRLVWEAHQCWNRIYGEIHGVLQPINPGYADWSALYSHEPIYMLQCDFSYMISPGMFDAFAKPELEAMCAKLSRSFYHLDGPGALPHLESMLAIDALDGVQWVPGAGHPNCAHWPHVYQQIHAAGKRIQVIDDDLDSLDAVVRQIGTGCGIHQLLIRTSIDQEDAVRRRLEQYEIG